MKERRRMPTTVMEMVVEGEALLVAGEGFKCGGSLWLFFQTFLEFDEREERRWKERKRDEKTGKSDFK